jgi:transposase-like protein
MKPRTLQEAILYFSEPDNCLNFIVAQRWPDGVSCPTCGRKDVVFLANRRKWQCKTVHHHRQFSVKVGTIFEDSPIGLDKWLAAMWMVCNDKNGISSYEIHRALGVTQKSAWFMAHRIRLALQNGGIMGKLQGHVEVDETFIGGKARNMHKSRRDRMITGRGTKGKTVIMGFLQRGEETHSQVKAQVIENRHRPTMQTAVRDNVAEGSRLLTDEFSAYTGLEGDFDHAVINHAIEYVNGQVHTNGMENFWSLFKRGLHGTYVSVEPFHLFRYIDEQSFRFNNRGTRKAPVNDAQRFALAVSQIMGKRVTFDQLTGKTQQDEICPF